ncbi:hypothetical protein PG987_000267 [Apiospora arundinis]
MSTSYLPFLYQTRTILCTRLPLNRTVARTLHTTSTRFAKRDKHIPFESDVRTDEEVLPQAKEKRRALSLRPSAKLSRASSPTLLPVAQSPRLDDDLPLPSPTARRSTNFILNAAANEMVDTRAEIVASPAQMAEASKDRSKALLRFPPSLRAAANRAFNILKPNYPSDEATESIGSASQAEADEPPNSVLLRMVEMNAKREPEERRVNELMESASSDFELWEILEEEVFSLPGKFGLVMRPDAQQQRIQEKQAIEENRSKKRKKVPAQERKLMKHMAKLQREQELTDEELAERKQNMYQYGPLYPAFLLKGLRLLDSNFPQSSRLTLNVLPRVKELGLESYVLGVSTPFYNELLRIYYHRYGDLERMLDLLEEMRHSGLYFDEGTASILDQVHNQTKNLANGKYGPFGQVLMTMPEYEDSVRTRIGHWKRGVDISIQQRDHDIDYQKLR